jgi:hypothetical protein
VPDATHRAPSALSSLRISHGVEASQGKQGGIIPLVRRTPSIPLREVPAGQLALALVAHHARLTGILASETWPIHGEPKGRWAAATSPHAGRTTSAVCPRGREDPGIEGQEGSLWGFGEGSDAASSSSR